MSVRRVESKVASKGARAALAALLLLAVMIPGHAQNPATNIPVAGVPQALVVNPVTNQVYLASNGGGVTVIDGSTNNTTSVTAGNFPIAAAVNPVTNKIYIVNANDNTVTVIDGAANKAASSPVAVGKIPVAVAVNPVTNKIYVSNSGDNTVTVIDGATNKAATPVAVGIKPRTIAVNTVTNQVYVGNQGDQSVTVIDGASNNVTHTVTGVPVTSTSSALAVNPVSNKIYVAGVGSGLLSGVLTVIDGETLAQVSLSATAPNSIAINPVSNKIYVADGGSLDVVDGASNNITSIDLRNVITTLGFGMSVNPTTNQVYATFPNNDKVVVLDGATNQTKIISLASGSIPGPAIINPVTNKVYVATQSTTNPNVVLVIDGATNAVSTENTGVQPEQVAVNPVTNTAYIANSSGSSVLVLNQAAGTATTVGVGSFPSAVAVNSLTNKVYIANQNDGTVTVIDGATNQAAATVKTGGTPNSLAVNPVTNKIYAAFRDDPTVTVIDGATNNPATIPLPAGIACPLFACSANSLSIVANPVTNKIYVVNSDSNAVIVIDGATNATKTVSVGTNPFSLALNAITNKIYVSNNGSNSLSIIDGATDTVANTVAVGANPFQVAVNPMTNKIYVSNPGSGNVTEMDGKTLLTQSASAGKSPAAIAVNTVSNKIYVTDQLGNVVTVLDGSAKAAVTIPVGSTPLGVAINTITNQAYITNEGSNTVTVITESPSEQIPLSTTIAPQAGGETATPVNFGFTESSAFSPHAPPVENIFFQLDTWQGPWIAATGNGPQFGGTASPSFGTHVVYAFATDGQHATAPGLGQYLTGQISAQVFTVNAADFSISSGAASVTVKAGQTATFTLQLAALAGDPSNQFNVTVTCTGAPSKATCAGPLSPVTVTPGTPASLNVSVSTTANAGTLPPGSNNPISPLFVVGLFGLMALAAASLINARSGELEKLRLFRRRPALSVSILVMALTVTLLAMAGCGGGGSTPPPPPLANGTPPGTYNLTVTATSGNVTHSLQLTLTVQ